jgi:hypothetical protein
VTPDGLDSGFVAAARAAAATAAPQPEDRSFLEKRLATAVGAALEREFAPLRVTLNKKLARYLVSPRGETDWVRNLRRASEGELNGGPFRAVEVPVAERARFSTATRRWPGESSPRTSRRCPARPTHPVFRITGA